MIARSGLPVMMFRMENPLSRLSKSGMAVLFALLAANWPIYAREFQIERVQIQNGRAEIRFLSELGFYYILRKGDTVSDIHLASDLALGDGLEQSLSDTNIE